jgi:hypothetical protein
VIFLYIVLFFVACGFGGKLLNRRSDGRQSMTNELDDGTRERLRPGRTVLDTTENPRNVDDGTSFGYKEFD